ncbi:MAG TPA: hypothetical protein VGB85_11965 [Nannocystis sp.]|jgi:hypothetical protein
MACKALINGSPAHASLHAVSTLASHRPVTAANVHALASEKVTTFTHAQRIATDRRPFIYSLVHASRSPYPGLP